jgi:hypothetical protein
VPFAQGGPRRAAFDYASAETDGARTAARVLAELL